MLYEKSISLINISGITQERMSISFNQFHPNLIYPLMFVPLPLFIPTLEQFLPDLRPIQDRGFELQFINYENNHCLLGYNPQDGRRFFIDYTSYIQLGSDSHSAILELASELHFDMLAIHEELDYLQNGAVGKLDHYRRGDSFWTWIGARTMYETLPDAPYPLITMLERGYDTAKLDKADLQLATELSSKVSRWYSCKHERIKENTVIRIKLIGDEGDTLAYVFKCPYQKVLRVRSQCGLLLLPSVIESSIFLFDRFGDHQLFTRLFGLAKMSHDPDPLGMLS